MNTTTDTLDITAISIFYDTGINSLRREATLKAVQRWMLQKTIPSDFIFVELGFDGTFTFNQSDFPEPIRYIRLDGTDSNKFLFQKEPLWNISAKFAKHDKLMFIDSDMSPLEDVDWFKVVSDTLNTCLFAQGFRTFRYLDQNDVPTGDMKWATIMNPTSDIQNHLPGGIYCINKDVLETVGGFNVCSCLGDGDSVFFNEFGTETYLNSSIKIQIRDGVLSKLKALATSTNRKPVGKVPIDIFHFYHGDVKNRSYVQRAYMLLTQYPWMDRIIGIDEQGLLYWIDNNHWFKDVLSKLHTVNDDPNRAHELMKEHFDYLGFLNTVVQFESQGLSKEQTKYNISNLVKKYDKDNIGQGCMIPKIIHFIWFGEMKPEFNEVVEQTKKMNPNFKVNLVNELDLDHPTNPDVIECLELCKTHPFYKNFHNRIDLQGYFNSYENRGIKLNPSKRKTTMFSDVFRLYLLNKYGGIYLDLDIIWNKPFDEILLNRKKFLMSVPSGTNGVISTDGKPFADCFFMGSDVGLVDDILSLNGFVPDEKMTWLTIAGGNFVGYTKQQYIKHLWGKTYLEPTIPQNKVLYFDVAPYHEEVAIGVCDYLKKCGCDLTVMLNQEFKGVGLEGLLPSGIKVGYSTEFGVLDYAMKHIQDYSTVFCGTPNKLFPMENIAKTGMCGIVHHKGYKPDQDVLRCFKDGKKYSLTDFNDGSCKPIPLTTFGQFKPDLDRVFSRRIFFPSRMEHSKTAEFIRFLNRNQNWVGEMTKRPSTIKTIVPKNLTVRQNMPMIEMLKLANSCSFIFMSIDTPPTTGKVLYASGSFQIARALGLVPIFKDSGEPFGFPDDCCITYSTEEELDRKLASITSEKYVELRENLIESTKEIHDSALKQIANDFKIKREKTNMKLQILVTQYKETKEVIKPLLDSLALQQGIDFNEVGVIIVNDGYSKSKLPEKFLKSYPFKIDYYLEEHRGVSGTRNSCLDHATADYVMFCDADDMFFSEVGLNIIFVEMDKGFDSLTTKFYEELHRDGKVWFTEHKQDRTFVHGKFHRRQYLIDKNIRFNDALTVHEDSYFNYMATTLADNPNNIKYSDVPIYLWKWRDESVCRHDPLYLQKTYTNYLDSITSLVDQLVSRGKGDNANMLICTQMFDTYYLMNTPAWLNQDNQTYRLNTEKRFKEFYLKFSERFYGLPDQFRMNVSNQVRAKKIQSGMGMEKLTFDQWIEYIQKLG